ncbi:hypothetical protein [Spirosoma validum]|uniref:Uncharacterized protein n=1 Tax=Spirosoma validum TaxID=2771355 RepID=A0A927GHL8_9BACT|nr:hypothetical protein [Spirosoma validum]MBD2757853.1 hypothetical protein [Spirosoma validum]
MQLSRTIARQRLANSATSFFTNLASIKQPNYIWLAVCLLLHAQMGKAQFDQTTQQTVADSSRGYWRLKTEAASRTTLIQFFGPNNQLLYVENLPEKWVKLSRKNQKQFDQLLEQLLANQLVTSRIKTEILPPTPELPTPPNVTVRSNSPQNAPSADATYRVHAYVNSIGKLYLIVDNPERLRYKILVADQRDRTLYEEFTNHDQYRRKLDLSALPQDSYQVVVQIDNKPFIYNIRRQDTRFAYSIQPPNSVVRKEATNEQNQAEKKPLLMPVNIDL